MDLQTRADEVLAWLLGHDDPAAQVGIHQLDGVVAQVFVDEGCFGLPEKSLVLRVLVSDGEAQAYAAGVLEGALPALALVP